MVWTWELCTQSVVIAYLQGDSSRNFVLAWALSGGEELTPRILTTTFMVWDAASSYPITDK